MAEHSATVSNKRKTAPENDITTKASKASNALSRSPNEIDSSQSALNTIQDKQKRVRNERPCGIGVISLEESFALLPTSMEIDRFQRSEDRKKILQIWHINKRPVKYLA
jgi:hypothetical protein